MEIVKWCNPSSRCDKKKVGSKCQVCGCEDEALTMCCFFVQLQCMYVCSMYNVPHTENGLAFQMMAFNKVSLDVRRYIPWILWLVL